MQKVMECVIPSHRFLDQSDPKGSLIQPFCFTDENTRAKRG